MEYTYNVYDDSYHLILENKKNIGTIYSKYKITQKPILCNCYHCSDYLEISKKQLFFNKK